MEQTDIAARVADNSVERQRISGVRTSLSDDRTGVVDLDQRVPIFVDNPRAGPTRLAPPKPFRVELRLGIFRIRCHARILPGSDASGAAQ
jgi:hypothetical protein